MEPSASVCLSEPEAGKGLSPPSSARVQVHLPASCWGLSCLSDRAHKETETVTNLLRTPQAQPSPLSTTSTSRLGASHTVHTSRPMFPPQRFSLPIKQGKLLHLCFLLLVRAGRHQERRFAPFRITRGNKVLDPGLAEGCPGSNSVEVTRPVCD